MGEALDRMLRKLQYRGLLVIGILVAFMVVSQTAFAIQFTGMLTITPADAVRGARARVERYNPDVTAQTSSAWAMVHNSTRSGYQAIAQVGYV
jgi:hypothetical protein